MTPRPASIMLRGASCVIRITASLFVMLVAFLIGEDAARMTETAPWHGSSQIVLSGFSGRRLPPSARPLDPTMFDCRPARPLLQLGDGANGTRICERNVAVADRAAELRHEFAARGWHVDYFADKAGHVMISASAGNQAIDMFLETVPQTSRTREVMQRRLAAKAANAEPTAR